MGARRTCRPDCRARVPVRIRSLCLHRRDAEGRRPPRRCKGRRDPRQGRERQALRPCRQRRPHGRPGRRSVLVRSRRATPRTPRSESGSPVTASSCVGPRGHPAASRTSAASSTPTASSSAPAPPARAPGAGRHVCGFTDSGGGICLDVGGSGTGQFVTNGKFEDDDRLLAVARFRLSITLGGQVRLGDLKFPLRRGIGRARRRLGRGRVRHRRQRHGHPRDEGELRRGGAQYTCESTTTWSAKIQR